MKCNTPLITKCISAIVINFVANVVQEFALCFSDLEHVLKSIELEEYGGKEGDSHKAKTYFNIALHILFKWK